MTAPRLDHWLIAGTSRYAIYPCRCVLGRRCQARYNCRGRTDGHLMKPHCCAYTARTA
jgi:hypothetical protein